MDKHDAIHVLEEIRAIYPKYELSKKKAKILIPELMMMDYKHVLKKLSAHAKAYPYPPTIAEIAVYPAERNDHLEKVEAWRTEASKVPFATKSAFHKQMTQLIKEKAHDSHKQY